VLASLLVAERGVAEPPVAPARTDALGRTGDASVSLGVVRAEGDVRSEVAGFLRLQFPFERLMAPRRLLLAAADEVGFPEEDDERRESTGVDEAGGAVEPALDPALLGRLARDTLAAAANAHGVAAYERELDGAASRARSSAVLPEVRLRVARSRDQSLRYEPTLDDPNRQSLLGGDGTLLEAQATFRLNRLLFADEEVPLERLRIERERLDERLEFRVLARVVAWHRALSRERSPLDAEARGRAAVERIDAEIELDALTGGWFGERVRQLRLEAAPVERRDPRPLPAAPPKPASKSKTSQDCSGSAVVAVRDSARAAAPERDDLEGCSGSATSAEPCLPRLATDSRTFKGASMR
jgi:hypothetical protein